MQLPTSSHEVSDPTYLLKSHEPRGYKQVVRSVVISHDERESAAERLVALLDLIYQRRYPIDSIIIIQDGDVLLDCHFYPFGSEQSHPIYSCTKSILSLLLGIAFDRGVLGSVSQPISDFFPRSHPVHADPRKRKITIEHLLTMRSGLEFKDFGGGWSTYFDMLNSEDMLERALSREMANAPGRTFHYNNSGSHILCYLLHRATGMSPLEYAYDHLFGPLGISQVAWEVDPQSGNTGWTGLALRPFDLAKIGELCLNGGRWDRSQVVSTDWVRRSTQSDRPVLLSKDYGYHWWICPEYHMAAGHFGQYLFVAPRYNAVVAICSSLESHKSSLPEFMMERYILPALANRTARHPVGENLGRLSALAQKARSADREPHFVWTSREQGVAHDGIFRRQTLPAFTFRFPPRVMKRDITDSLQIAAMMTYDGCPFFVSIADIPGTSLEGAAAHYLRKARLVPGIGEVTIHSNERFQLVDGVPAQRTEIRYRLHSSVGMRGVIVSAFRNGKWVYLEGHTPYGIAEIDAIVHSLSFMDGT